ncbi:hypothetical protein HMPREF3213_01727 [Heyndrickxia coagulans]|uniref:Uncharacterized protein n=1 Tax=Heyndrickxia coagulans TaxID=1398 RepID=A0A133KSJ1_HEYCO|nr:hypothetical protein HMPREF3213_01727 [Heyndrickxia coagulans]
MLVVQHGHDDLPKNILIKAKLTYFRFGIPKLNFEYVHARGGRTFYPSPLFIYPPL